MNTNGRYILDENKMPVPEPDLFKWADWFENIANRRVAEATKDGVRVSTVFLGLDHSFGDDSQPVLFETMIFGGTHDGYEMRCCTWRDALVMHAIAVKLAFGDQIKLEVA